MEKIAKAEDLGKAPDFLSKYECVRDTHVFLEKLQASGYRHCIGMKPNRLITVGPAICEWHHIGVASFFFKRFPPHDMFSILKEGGAVTDAGEIPTIEYRKFCCDMPSYGTGWYCATLETTDVADWIKFFEPNDVKVAETAKYRKLGYFPEV